MRRREEIRGEESGGESHAKQRHRAYLGDDRSQDLGNHRPLEKAGWLGRSTQLSETPALQREGINPGTATAHSGADGTRFHGMKGGQPGVNGAARFFPRPLLFAAPRGCWGYAMRSPPRGQAVPSHGERCPKGPKRRSFDRRSYRLNGGTGGGEWGGVPSEIRHRPSRNPSEIRCYRGCRLRKPAQTAWPRSCLLIGNQ